MTLTPSFAPGNESELALLQLSTFQYLTPINLILALYILLQDSLVLLDQYPERQRVSSLLFLLVAATDIITAVSQLVRGCAAALCLANQTLYLPRWALILYISPGLFSYMASTFFYVVLTVVKTARIVDPFNPVNGDLVKYALVLIPAFSFLVSLLDLYCWLQHFDHITPDRDTGYKVCTLGQQRVYDNIIFIGGGVATRLLDFLVIPDKRLLGALTMALLFSEYVVPCVVVLSCMVLQMVSLKVALGHGGGSRAVNHANCTVFLISILFLVCNGSFPLSFLVLSIFEVKETFPGYPFFLMAKFTFPLLNAALFPTIIILRKPSLRKRYKGYVIEALKGAVALSCLKTHSHTRGYIPL